MNSYLLSIFVRGSVAASGFLVFVVSSRLYGPEGRGVMSYGTSIFASIGLIFSFNLGRGFIAKTERNQSLKNQYLFTFLLLNILATFGTVLLGFIFWNVSSAAQKILDFRMFLPLTLTALTYVWAVNGNSFFAALQQTRRQELVILTTRCVLTVFLALMVVLPLHSLETFLAVYASILGFGILTEWLLLWRNLGGAHKVRSFSDVRGALKGSFWPHVDFLSFHLFPIVLILIAGQFLEKANIGRINFAIQIVNLIFLLSTTANIRINAYVSNWGFRNKLPQIKKLFLGTVLLSAILVGMAVPALSILTQRDSFSSFQGVESLFLVAVIGIPGYLVYHFLYPLWLEAGLMKESSLLNFINSVLFVMISFWAIRHHGEIGALWCFAGFHLGCLVNQILMLAFFLRKTSRNKDVVVDLSKMDNTLAVEEKSLS